MAKEMNKLFLLFFSFVLQHIHVQGFDVIFVAAEFEEMSTEYFDPKNSFVYIDADKEPPHLISNITIIKDLPENTYFGFTALGYSMGEYRIPIGMDYFSKACEAYEDNLILGPVLKGLGFIDGCPPTVGTYVNTGYIPDTSIYPDQFPRNQYEISIHITIDDESILIAKIDLEVL